MKRVEKIVLISFVAAVFLIACNKDNEQGMDTNTAGHRIAQSEKLIIPAEVDLPVNGPGGNARVATYYAEGVQKYKAQAKAGGGLEWVFVAPEAVLYDALNNKVGTHGAGPFWSVRKAQSGSNDSIFAQQFSPARTAIPDADHIAWLQLMPKAGTIPTGIFADVDYIQRIATTGGKAPATFPMNITDTANVFYSAVYRFSKRN